MKALACALLAVLAATGMTVGSAACGAPATDDDRGTAAGRSADLDRYVESDVAFFNRFVLHAARLASPPPDLKEAAGRATAVIVAEVADVRLTRSIVAAPDDVVPMIGIELRPVETLHGQLRPELGGKVIVEMLGGSSAPAVIEAMRSSLPRGRSVWFLLWQGEPSPNRKPGAPPDTTADRSLYGLVALHAMFAQGPAHVVSPLVEPRQVPGYSDMQTQGESYARLSDLVAYLRDLK